MLPHVKLYKAPEGENSGVIMHVGVVVLLVALPVKFPVDVVINDVAEGDASGRPPMSIIAAIRD